MLPLKNNSILLPHQVSILKLFFASPLSKSFFLTGGTALSAFYLVHRQSQDLDLFTLSEFDTLLLKKTIDYIAAKTQSEIIAKVKTENYLEVYLESKKDHWVQRLDFVHEQPVHFGRIATIDTVRIDSLENIATNKILSIYGRLELKDYLDLYFILNEAKPDFYKLFDLAKKKDTGLHEFYFANIIVKVTDFTIFPKLQKPFDKRRFHQTFLSLSKKLILKARPK